LPTPVGPPITISGGFEEGVSSTFVVRFSLPAIVYFLPQRALRDREGYDSL